MTPVPAFPLAGVVAVVGSRHGSPYPVGQFAAAVVQAGGSVVTGCARGVDQVAARTAAAAAGVHPARLLPPAYLALNHLPRVLVCRAYDRSARALAQRTRRVVEFAQAVAVFPPAGQPGPGSTLALSLALRRACSGVAVFYAGPVPPPAVPYQPPGTWQPAAVAGVAGWLWSPLPDMPPLF